MRLADWIVLGGALAYVVLFGLWRSRRTNTVNKYLLAGRSMPWHVVGLSIMATQASAITFVSTTGQSYVDGMRFVQFYFGLPIAMAILAYTAVPIFHRARVYTAYEYLEQRFDTRTRALVSAIFLIQRGLALGISLYAPAVVLTVILGWPDWLTTCLMGGIAIAYATVGGAKAIAWTDFQQMLVMVAGLVAAFMTAVWLLPPHVSFANAVGLAEVAGRLNVITTTVDWNDRYNLWSGLIGGAFLAMAYFGTDQSQVQRYLTGRSIAESRRGLFFNAAAKIPMQLFILFIGAMVFVFYVYEKPPVLFQPTELARVEQPALRDAYTPIAERYDTAFADRRAAADKLIDARRSGNALAFDNGRQAYDDAQRQLDAARRDAAALAVEHGGSRSSDTNYIFLTFVTQHLPAGLVGLVLAVIFGATMSSISGEMSALASVSMIDVYKRHVRSEASDHHYLTVSRLATVFWGLYAMASAQYAKRLGSLVEAVNVLGSLFYGTMLGVFVVAFFFKRVNARSAFVGALAGQAAIFACWYFTSIAFLWYNVIGCVVVVATATMLSAVGTPEKVKA
ncbi:MAG: sodium:solute symporter [Acidobacteria bacterium]|nr:sodium:solute symporter [Acidobacteriota bacterium]